MKASENQWKSVKIDEQNMQTDETLEHDTTFNHCKYVSNFY